ncbi:MerR family transcriptional regulator [Streptodolium elevatio]
MRIGELAALLGVSTRTVRPYHHQGVLPEAVRLSNGYREYGMRDAVALARVRRLVELGLSLDEVRDVIADDRARELPEILHDIDASLARQETEIRVRRARLAELLARADAGALDTDDTASPAQATRPHVVSESELRIRNGAVSDLRVPRASIVSARVARRWDHERTLSVANGEMALALSHQTNVLVQLSESVTVHGWRGPRGEARTLRIHADDAQAMVDALTATDRDESRPASNRAPARSTATPAATRTAAPGLSGSE